MKIFTVRITQIFTVRITLPPNCVRMLTGRGDRDVVLVLSLNLTLRRFCAMKWKVRNCIGLMIKGLELTWMRRTEWQDYDGNCWTRGRVISDDVWKFPRATVCGKSWDHWALTQCYNLLIRGLKQSIFEIVVFHRFDFNFVDCWPC